MSIILLAVDPEYDDASRHPLSCSLSKDASQILDLSDCLDKNGFHRDKLIWGGSQSFYGRSFSSSLSITQCCLLPTCFPSVTIHNRRGLLWK